MPDAEILLLGTTDGFANIHAPNERVLVDEFEKAVLAEAEFFAERYAEATRDERSGRRRRGSRSWSACSTRSSAAETRCRTPR